MTWQLVEMILVLIIVTAGNTDEIVFITQPHDVQIVVGEDAFFPCTYNGSNIAPSWIINGQRVSSSDPELPFHRFNGTGFIVQNNDLTHHLWQYSCYVNVYSQNTRRFVDCQSSTGTLYVYQAESLSVYYVTTTVITTPIASSIIIGLVKPESTISTTNIAAVLPSSADVHNETVTFASPVANGVYIGITVSGISVVIVVFVTTLVVLKKKILSQEKRMRETQIEPEPLYEQILPATTANPCYEIVHSKINNIQTFDNNAYASSAK